MTSPANLTLALIAMALFGLLFGILLALLGVMAYMLHKAATEISLQAKQSAEVVVAKLGSMTRVVDQLRGEVALSLSRMDADRLHDAATQIQQGAKALGHQTKTLSQLLFATAGQPQFNSGAPLAGFPDSSPMDGSFSMEDEALDDATMLAERARWNRGQQGQAQAQGQATAWPPASPPSPLNIPVPDVFIGKSQTEINRMVEAFFERRRNGTVDPVADAAVNAMAERMAGGGGDRSGAIQSAQSSSASSLPDLPESYSLDQLARDGYGGGADIDFGAMPSRGDMDE